MPDPLLTRRSTQPSPTPATDSPASTAPLAAPTIDLVGRDAPVDLFDSGGRPVDVARPSGLPPVLFERAGVRVEHGTDPGDFYCEHAFYTQQRFAAEVGVKKNAFGEPLCGFLHVPRDAECVLPADAPIDIKQRYALHAQVIGAAFFGYFDTAKTHGAPVKILLTGYGPFMSITNNPSGGFVSHRENIDAAMKVGFGTSLMAGEKLIADRGGGAPEDTFTLKYRVNDGGRIREIIIYAERLHVADVELDNGDAGSLVGALKSVKPDAVLSLGVHGGTQFLVEHHADDGGLAILPSGSAMHDDNKLPAHAFADNYALARAVYAGTRGPLRVADARIGRG